MKKIWQVIVLIFNWFIRRKPLYRLTGVTAFGFIFLELGAAIIPIEANPDYQAIQEKYGELAKTIFGWIVDKFASGTNYLNLSIACAILVICLLIEYKILKPNAEIRAKNVFSGWFQINKQTNYYDKN